VIGWGQRSKDEKEGDTLNARDGLVREAERLSRFAVIARYPGIAPPLDGAEYDQAIATADRVVRWAVEFISA